MGFIETLFDYYLPGLDYKSLTDAQFAQKYVHLQFIRELEAKDAVQLAKAGLVSKRRS